MSDETKITLTEDGQEAYDAYVASIPEGANPEAVEGWVEGLDDVEREVYLAKEDSQENTNTTTESEGELQGSDGATTGGESGVTDKDEVETDKEELSDLAKDESGIEEQINPTEGMSDAVIAIHARLMRYADDMGIHRRHTQDSGKRQQSALYQIILAVLGMEGKDFKDGMEILLNCFRQNTQGAFSERMVFRFIPYIPLQPNDVQLFQSFMTLFIATVKNDRAAVKKHVDIGKIASRMSDPKKAAKLLGFYSAD